MPQWLSGRGSDLQIKRLLGQISLKPDNYFSVGIVVIIRAHKRSLRRLCFYTCLSVILFTGGVPGQVHPQAGTPPWVGTPWAGTPQADTPSQAGTPPGRYTSPQAGTPPPQVQAGTPPPRQVHLPPGRYPPRQVHPLRQVHPQAGTPLRQVHPLGRYTPPLGRYTTPLGRYTTPRQVLFFFKFLY